LCPARRACTHILDEIARIRREEKSGVCVHSGEASSGCMGTPQNGPCHELRRQLLIRACHRATLVTDSHTGGLLLLLGLTYGTNFFERWARKRSIVCRPSWHGTMVIQNINIKLSFFRPWHPPQPPPKVGSPSFSRRRRCQEG
jgi:hypothetical protein